MAAVGRVHGRAFITMQAFTRAAVTPTAQALAHGQAQRLHTRMAEVGDDGAIGAAQQSAQRTAQFGRQHLAHVGAVGHGLDATDHGVAHDIGAQRIAFTFAAGFGQHGGHIGVQLAQFPFAGVCDLHAKTFGGDLCFDLAVFDQAQRVPVGGCRF